MKKIIAVVLCFSVVLCFASCGSQQTSENATGELVFDNAEEAYEAMADAVAEGDYAKAVECYDKGAADSAESDILDLYFYSLAMKEYTENGCVGYPLYLLQTNVSADFEKAASVTTELKGLASKFSGAYNCNENYIYFSGGKIAFSSGTRLSGQVVCIDELVYKNNSYYCAARGDDGSHKLMYLITVTDEGFLLEATDENTDGKYSGAYTVMPAVFPELTY